MFHSPAVGSPSTVNVNVSLTIGDTTKRASLLHVTPLIAAVTPPNETSAAPCSSVTAAASASTSAAWSRDSWSSSPHPVTSDTISNDTITNDTGASAIAVTRGRRMLGRSITWRRRYRRRHAAAWTAGTTATRDGWGPLRFTRPGSSTSERHQPIGAASATIWIDVRRSISVSAPPSITTGRTSWPAASSTQ